MNFDLRRCERVYGRLQKLVVTFAEDTVHLDVAQSLTVCAHTAVLVAFDCKFDQHPAAYRAVGALTDFAREVVLIRR